MNGFLEIACATEWAAPEARRLVATSDVVVANMPEPSLKANGLDYETLAIDQPGLVYCAITGYGQPADRERALQTGFSDHFVKPVLVTDVLHAVLKVLP